MPKGDNPNSRANLKPLIKAGKEAREKGRKGGIASVKVRRTTKDIREWAEQNLFKQVDYKVQGKEHRSELYQVLFNKLQILASQGNLKAIQMLMDYSGLKPIDKLEANVHNDFEINDKDRELAKQYAEKNYLKKK